jgi:ribosomal protein L40E
MITTFCPRCGSENPFENQFCGKCGIPLLQPKPTEQPVAAARANGSQRSVSAAEPDAETDQNLHGPSFLGLSDEPDLSSYLLDEDASVSHWGLYLFLVVLAVAAGLVWWQTRTGGLDRSHLADIVQAARSKIGQEKQEAAAVAPNANPASAENSGVANAATGASNGTAAPAVAPPPSTADIQKAAPKQNVPPAALSETVATAKPPSAPAKPQPKPRPAASTSDSNSADAQNAALLTSAQKYLYGQGVPQSCDRALSYLRQAVDGGSAKAKSTLGSMYATGHCVPLDRSVAYKWFALALRQEPNNSYLSHDLEMLWNQMTPAQKQLAIRMTQ